MADTYRHGRRGLFGLSFVLFVVSVLFVLAPCPSYLAESSRCCHFCLLPYPRPLPPRAACFGCLRHDEKGLAEGEAALSKLEKEVKSKEAERREVSQFRVLSFPWHDLN